MATEPQIDPESLDARMMAELQANPAARLERAMAELKVALQHSSADTACLMSMDVEDRLHRSVRSRVSQALGLRRARIMQSQLLEPLPELVEQMDSALADGLINDDQDSRVEATDVILQAERKNDGAAIWVAIEAPISLNENDIQRARESADVLAVIFEQPTEAAVVGHRIGVLDEERADAARVHVLLVAPGL